MTSLTAELSPADWVNFKIDFFLFIYLYLFTFIYLPLVMLIFLGLLITENGDPHPSISNLKLQHWNHSSHRQHSYQALGWPRE